MMNGSPSISILAPFRISLVDNTGITPSVTSGKEDWPSMKARENSTNRPFCKRVRRALSGGGRTREERKGRPDAEDVALGAEAGDDAGDHVRQERPAAEPLAGENVGEVDLDDRD
jgi:hypothetical protein